MRPSVRPRQIAAAAARPERHHADGCGAGVAASGPAGPGHRTRPCRCVGLLRSLAVCVRRWPLESRSPVGDRRPFSRTLDAATLTEEDYEYRNELANKSDSGALSGWTGMARGIQRAVLSGEIAFIDEEGNFSQEELVALLTVRRGPCCCHAGAGR